MNKIKEQTEDKPLWQDHEEYKRLCKKLKLVKVPKPKYRIGDIVVYLDRYEDYKNLEFQTVIQSKIVEATALMEREGFEDPIEWFYRTEEVNDENSDSLNEDDIIYKL